MPLIDFLLSVIACLIGFLIAELFVFLLKWFPQKQKSSRQGGSPSKKP